jgi:hypothetical protein
MNSFCFCFCCTKQYFIQQVIRLMQGLDTLFDWQAAGESLSVQSLLTTGRWILMTAGSSNDAQSVEPLLVGVYTVLEVESSLCGPLHLGLARQHWIHPV